MTILALSSNSDDYGVYVGGYRNSYGTPLAFRGTLDERLAFRRKHTVTQGISGARITDAAGNPA